MARPLTRHLTEGELVAELDRERTMDARQAAHLESCWSCRTRLDEMQGAVAAFVRLRDEDLLALPELPAVWPGLDPGMDRVDAEKSGRSLWSRLRQKSTGAWSSRVAIAASVILVLTIAGATPAAAARAVWDAVRFVGSIVSGTKPPAAVVPLPRAKASADVHLPGPLAASVNEVRRPRSGAPRRSAPVNLVDLELEALWQLHRVDALVGEEVVIDRSTQGLSVRVRVGDVGRKARLNAALASVAAGGARVRVETFVETDAARSVPAPTDRVVFHEVKAVADDSAAAALLRKHFGAQFGSESHPRVAEATREFSSRVLSSSRQIALQALALQRLFEGLSNALDQASEPSRATYRVLVREYAGGIESRAAALSRDLQSVFGNEPHAVVAERGTEGIQGVATAAVRLDDDVRAVFAVQTSPDQLRAVEGGKLLGLARAVERGAAEIRRSNSY